MVLAALPILLQTNNEKTHGNSSADELHTAEQTKQPVLHDCWSVSGGESIPGAAIFRWLLQIQTI